ncbi:MAG: ribonuclease P protein component [Opitutales bacterium]|nr:ribonuclease P protein component [Opitutales bacterium]
MRFGWQTRLARSSEIDRVFRNGRRQNCGAFLLITCRRENVSGQSTPRMCVIASRRVSKRAVDRNRLKRRMRALYRLNQSIIPEGYDLVMIARNSMMNSKFAELDRRFKKACAQLSVS